MCEARATTREHAPAKMFFPEAKDLPGTDLRRDLITVPSCPAHNTATSKDDEYAVAIVAAHHTNARLAADHFATKVLRALQRSGGYVAAVSRNSQPVTINGAQTRALRVDDGRFELVMEKTARALYFHHTGRKWPGLLLVISPSFVQEVPGTQEFSRHAEFDELEANVNLVLVGGQEQGANPDVFFYQIVEHAGHVVMRMTFYRGFTVYAVKRNDVASEPDAG